MTVDKLYNSLRSEIENKISLQVDKPEETLDSSLHALWLKSAGISKSAELAELAPLPELNEEKLIELKQLIQQRISGVPLAYLTGCQSFMGIELICDKRALIPRKETEILARKALELSHEISLVKKPVIIFDVCSGSGNLGLTLAHFNSDSLVYSSDLSPEAVNLIRDNRSLLKLDKQVDVRQSDLFASYEDGSFYSSVDLIVCNPPYISSSKVTRMNSEIAQFEPSMAFDGGMMGFKIIQKLILEAPRFLNKNGWLIFEVGLGQGPFIMQLCEKSGNFKQIGSDVDSLNSIRVVYASLRS